MTPGFPCNILILFRLSLAVGGLKSGVEIKKVVWKLEAGKKWLHQKSIFNRVG